MNFDAHFGTEGVVIKKKKKQQNLLIWVVLIDCVMVCVGGIVYESRTVVGRHPVPYFCSGGCLCGYLLGLSFGWLWFLWGSMLLALRCCLSVPRYFVISILVLNSPEKRLFIFFILYPSFSELVFWWFHKLLLCRVLHIVDAFETKFWESNPTKEYDILKERKGKERKKQIEITNSLRWTVSHAHKFMLFVTWLPPTSGH